jgi:hypothetical protein
MLPKLKALPQFLHKCGKTATVSREPLVQRINLVPPSDAGQKQSTFGDKHTASENVNRLLARERASVYRTLALLDSLDTETFSADPPAFVRGAPLVPMATFFLNL